MKKTLLLFAAAGLTALNLAACSTSSTSTSTVTTNINGQSTTTTVITENGKTTTTTVTGAAPAEETKEASGSAETAEAPDASEAAAESGSSEAAENTREGLYGTDLYTSRIDLTGCDTFTDIVDKVLTGGQAYANVTLDGTDVLLVSDDAFEFDGTAQAVSAEIFWYKDGTPAYAGYVKSGGSANPLTVNDEKLYTAGHHYVGSFTITDGQAVTVAEASETFDASGSVTYHYDSDDGGDYANLDQESAKTAYDELFAEYAEGEIVEFSIVTE